MSRPTGRPVLAVLHDIGSASPRDLVTACRDACDLVFVWDAELDQPEPARAVLASSGPVVAGAASDPEPLARQLAARGVTHLVTFSDRTMPLAAALAELLGIGYHRPEVVAALTDKATQRARLRSAGLVVPTFTRVRGIGDLTRAGQEMTFPAVVKPCAGGVSRSTYLVADRDELHRSVVSALTREPELIVEELLVGDPRIAGEGWGDHISVECVVWRGDLVWSGVTGKFPLAEPFRECGNIFPATLTDENLAAVRDEAGRAVAALGVHSAVCHVELKLTAAGPRIIEVNGRLGGWTSPLTERAAGYSLLRAAIDTALDRPPRPGPADRPGPVAFMWMLQPPRAAGAVRDIAGLSGVRTLPGVDTVTVGKRPGDPVDWRRGSLEYVLLVQGRVGDHAALARLVAEISAGVSVTYDPGEEPARDRRFAG